jgi:hypothetical protein
MHYEYVGVDNLNSNLFTSIFVNSVVLTWECPPERRHYDGWEKEY